MVFNGYSSFYEYNVIIDSKWFSLVGGGVQYRILDEVSDIMRIFYIQKNCGQEYGDRIQIRGRVKVFSFEISSFVVGQKSNGVQEK